MMDADYIGELYVGQAHPRRHADEMGVPDWMRELLLNERQALLIRLGKIEDVLGLERTVTPKRKR